MTTIFPIKRVCFLCKSTSEHHQLGSTNTFGYPDLDLRPSEMQRSTMRLWVQRCPSCGYCAPDVSKGSEEHRSIVASEEYQKQQSDDSVSGMANVFLCWSLLAQTQPTSQAAWAALHAAWCCDDAQNTIGANRCR